MERERWPFLSREGVVSGGSTAYDNLAAVVRFLQNYATRSLVISRCYCAERNVQRVIRHVHRYSTVCFFQ